MQVSKDVNYNPLFRQALFVLFLLALAWVLFDQLTFFIGSMLGAITLYVVFRGLQFRLTEKYNWRGWLAALMITVISLAILAAFGWWIAKIVASEIPNINGNKIVGDITKVVDEVNRFVGFRMIGPETVLRSEGLVSKVLSSAFNFTYSFIFNVSMMLVILYFMLSAGRQMECKLFAYAPFNGQSLSMLKREVKNMIYSNAVGIPVIIIAQTLAASLLYYWVGLESYLFLGFVTAICGLIPLVGTALVYTPIAIHFGATGQFGLAIIVMAYGLLIVSNLDNLIRIVLLGKYAHTHPLIVIFGVVVGIPLFGFWGIIFGPLFISGFLLLIKIYFVEYGLLDPEHPDVMCMIGTRKKKSFRDKQPKNEAAETIGPL